MGISVVADFLGEKPQIQTETSVVSLHHVDLPALLESLKGLISHKHVAMFFAFVLNCISVLYTFFFYFIGPSFLVYTH